MAAEMFFRLMYHQITPNEHVCGVTQRNICNMKESHKDVILCKCLHWMAVNEFSFEAEISQSSPH